MSNAIARSWRTQMAVVLAGLLGLSSCGVFKVVEKGETSVGDFQNLDFEEGEAGSTPDGWVVQSTVFDKGDPQRQRPVEGETVNYDLSLDPEVKRSGNLSLRLRHPGVDDQAQLPGERHSHSASIEYCRDVPFEDGLARVSAFVKVEGSQAFARLFVHPPRPSRPISGGESGLAGDWARYEAFQSMTGPGQMCIELGLSGVGTVWVDDISVEELEPGEGEVVSVSNLDMEEITPSGAPKGWSLSQGLLPIGEGQQGLAELRADPEVKHSGSNSSRLDVSAEAGPVPVAAMTCTDPSSFLGRWVRVSGWLRGELGGRLSEAGVSFNAFPVTRDAIVETVRSGDPSQLVGLRAASATGSWQTLKERWAPGQMVAFVPEQAQEVCIAFGTSEGTIWADDFRLEILDF